MRALAFVLALLPSLALADGLTDPQPNGTPGAVNYFGTNGRVTGDLTHFSFSPGTSPFLSLTSTDATGGTYINTINDVASEIGFGIDGSTVASRTAYIYSNDPTGLNLFAQGGARPITFYSANVQTVKFASTEADFSVPILGTTLGLGYAPGTSLTYTLQDAGTLAVVSDATFFSVLNVSPSGITDQNIGGKVQKLQALGTDNTAGLTAAIFQNNAVGTDIQLFKSRSNTVGGIRTVNTGDDIGNLSWHADDGTNYTTEVARVEVDATGTVSTGIVPGQMNFKVANSSGALVTPLSLIDGASTFTGQVSTTGKLTVPQLNMSGNVSAAAWTTNGIGFTTSASTYTDTTSSGTVPLAAIHAFGPSTVAATNPTTYSTVATVYISAVPTAGTNVTISNPRALQVNGQTAISGNTVINANATTPTSIGTGTTTGAVAIGGGSNAVTVTATTATLAGTTLNITATNLQRNGNAIQFDRTFTATYDPASLAAATQRADAVTVTGITTSGGAVSANPGVTPAARCVIASVRASAADTVTVVWQNVDFGVGGAACDTASSTWTFTQSQP